MKASDVLIPILEVIHIEIQERKKAIVFCTGHVKSREIKNEK